MTHLRLALRSLCLLSLGLVVGCNNNNPAQQPGFNSQYPRHTVEQGDPDAVYEAQPGREQVVRVQPQPAETNGRAITIDAMIGQVNGKPIYASSIFRKIGMEQLRRLGEANDARGFINEIAPLMADTLRQRVQDALILAEAEASLTQQEQAGLLNALQEYREQLISEAGGFLGGAEATIRRERGMSLSEAVEERRQEILTQKYLRDQLFPKINVNRREVERYYRENPDQFNPAAEITLRLLIVNQPIAGEVADAINKKGFDAAAESFADDLITDASARTFTAQQSTFEQLAFDELNEQIRQLQPGQTSDRVDIAGDRVAWVHLVDVEAGESIPLTDAYLDIERRLRAMEFERANKNYMRTLLEKGNFTPIEQMLDTLLNVAVNRFARPS